VCWCPDTQDLTKLSIEIMLICVQCQFSLPVVTEVNGLLLILCYERRDFQLKMHYRAFGGRTVSELAWGAQSASRPLARFRGWGLQRGKKGRAGIERKGRRDIKQVTTTANGSC